jgi:hypothetical protein
VQIAIVEAFATLPYFLWLTMTNVAVPMLVAVVVITVIVVVVIVSVASFRKSSFLKLLTQLARFF